MSPARIIINALVAVLAFVAGIAFAQTGERAALVIGNAAYPTAALANPKNDAQAMSGLLTEAGFAVDLRVDTSIEALRQAVTQFGQKIKDPKVKFAVFYYAGHGVQLDWHNYIIPVSARIHSAADVRAQTVDISELLKYMSEARSKNYVVILDACRDDPFGAAYRPPAKGLSQFDAPSGSVLAYSTAPGKVAFDGGGTHGLYTSYLLKEFAVKGVKIEDAFKRTRINVRIASNGKQTPWETTSLEEDLYLFPTPRRRLSEAEQDALLEEELQAWSKVRSTTDFLELADFIRKYPSGNVSELAASRLNRLLAQQQYREQRVVAARSESLRDAEQQRKALEEAVRIAAVRAEQARADAMLAEAVRIEAARVEKERQEAVRLEMAKADAAREEARRQQAQQLEAADAARRAEQERLAVAERNAANAALAAQQEAQRIRLERDGQERAQAAAVAAEREQSARAELAKQQLEQERLARAEAERLAQAQRAAAQQSTVVAANTVSVPSPRQEATSAEPDLLTEADQLPPTPFFSGSSANVRRYSVGDEYGFRVIDRFTKAEKPLVMRVTAADVRADRVEFNDGQYVSDLMGNILTNLVGSSGTPRQFYPAELIVGKRWTTRFKQVRPGRTYTFQYELKVVGKERVTVPAGTFDTYKIEARGFNVELAARIERDIWIAPGVNADIAHETMVRQKNGYIEQRDRQELVSLKQAAAIPGSSLASGPSAPVR